MYDYLSNNTFITICMLVSNAKSVPLTLILSQLLKKLGVEVRSLIRDDHISMTVGTPVLPDSVRNNESSNTLNRFQEHQLGKKIDYDVDMGMLVFSGWSNLDCINPNTLLLLGGLRFLTTGTKASLIPSRVLMQFGHAAIKSATIIGMQWPGNCLFSRVHVVRPPMCPTQEL